MKLPLFILFLVLLSLFSPLSKAQTTNSSNGYLCIKANVGSFRDNDQKRLDHGNPYYSDQSLGGFINVNGNPEERYYSQIQNKPFVSFGSEIVYFFKRYNFFGFNIGGAYSFDKTYYKFSSYTHYDPRNSSPIFRKIGNGSGSFSNHMFKFVWGMSFNFKFGLNVFIQPLNPEFRSIVERKDDFTFTTYQYFKYQTSGYDSASIYVSEEKRKVDFVNYKTQSNYLSLAFPTTIGIEQKFKIGKLKYVAGVSTSVSILERYLVYRAHIGVCLVNLKDKSQPGY